MRRDSAYDSKVVVITGASSGFGKGTADELAKRGCRLVLAARRGDVLQELSQACTLAGGEAIAVETDVSRAEDVERLVETAIARFGRVDVWINNAGVGTVGRFEDIPLAEHEQVIKTNLIGTIYGCSVALKQFTKQQTGTLINVASVVGKIAVPYYASYSASKYGVIGLTTSIRQELKQNRVKGIDVCLVMPAAMNTPFFEHAGNHMGKETVAVPPEYEAQKVVDVLVGLIKHPREEVMVGGAGPVAEFLHKILPGFVETAFGGTTHRSQTTAPPGPDTSGNVFEPMAQGTELHGKDA